MGFDLKKILVQNVLLWAFAYSSNPFVSHLF